MKYIGNFLRINSLTKENIESQLLFLSRESFKNILLNSKCGLTVPRDELKLKTLPNNDINIFDAFSPLICIYKKGSSKLILNDNALVWNEEKFKKEISIYSNAFMTLNTLQLVNYYKKFKDIDKNKYNLSILYTELAKKQLEFYAANFRNDDGIFIDKKCVSDDVSGGFKFQEKNKKNNYSDQAILMSAYYKYSLITSDDVSESFKNFSMDYLKMFINYKEEVYEADFSELNKLCFGLNLFYDYSKSKEALNFLFDIADLIINYRDEEAISLHEKEIKNECLLYVNCYLLYKHTNILKFRDTCCNIFKKLSSMYNPESGTFIKSSEKREINYYCDEIVLYLICNVLHYQLEKDEQSNIMVIDVFKQQIINSGIIPSWPEAPELEDVERYRNLSLNADDMLDEHFFRMNNIPTPESVEAAPVFIKSVTLDRKKSEFAPKKFSFDSGRNMFIFFTINYFLGDLLQII